MRFGSILTLIAAATAAYGSGFALWKFELLSPPTCARLFPGQEPVACFATPEGAALGAHFVQIERASGYKMGDTIHLNVPAGRSETAILEADLRLLAREISIIRDSSYFASAVISEDSLKTLGFVWDVRRTTDDPFDPQANYRVDSERCRTWPCHGGAGVKVRRMLSRHYVGSIRYTWVE